MTALIDRAQVKKALEDAGESWLFKYWGEKTEENLNGLIAQIKDFQTEYRQRFGSKPDPFTLLKTDPFKANAFFQIDTFMVSTEMKILIWRLLMGCEIVEAQFDYRLREYWQLTIKVRTPEGQEEKYHGKGPSDFKVLRHFGASSVNDQLVLQGYYALQRS